MLTCSKRNDLLVARFVNERAQSMVTYVGKLLFAVDERCMSDRTAQILNTEVPYIRQTGFQIAVGSTVDPIYARHTKYFDQYRHVRCHPTCKVRSIAQNRSAKTSFLLDTNTHTYLLVCARVHVYLFR